jgi:diadenosine tetraphosphate (Ap4A) HIT family hydrolase
VIPKYHAKTLGDLPDAYLAEIGPALKRVANATGAEQYNVLQASVLARAQLLRLLRSCSSDAARLP